jgi:endonuclease/exonuclease/phosphatase (EEP) superfamily protein YafD
MRLEHTRHSLLPLLGDLLLIFYSGAIFLRQVIRLLGGNRSGFSLTMDYFGLWLFLPLIFFIPFVVSRWRIERALLLVLPLFLFIHVYGSAFLPHAVDIKKADSLSAMTFNVRFNNTNTEALFSILQRERVDVVSLQEYFDIHDQALTTRMADIYPYHLSLGELVIFSRYPIVDQQTIPLHPLSALAATIDINGQRWLFINAHLAEPGTFPLIKNLDVHPAKMNTQLREQQIALILATIQQSQLPAVIACDCNMTELMADYKEVSSQLGDAYREAGWGPGHTLLMPRSLGISFPINVPAERLDYIFHTKNITASRVRLVTDESGSDHFPLIAYLILK